jgi:tetratricopeptide (TPR) repeat protein
MLSEGGHAALFWSELRDLYEAAGSPTLESLVRLGAKQTPPLDVGLATIGDWLTGKSLPGARDSQRYFAELVRFLKARAPAGHPGRSRSEGAWHSLLERARQERAANRGGRPRRPKDPASGVSRPPPPVTLPGNVPRLYGRDAEVGKLLEVLDPAMPGTPGTATGAVVAGLAGAGKTALVVHVAHEALRRGWCGGGVLFVDFGFHSAGSGSEPTAAEAAEGLLRALGERDVPSTADGRLARYRTRMNQADAPMLLVADNVCSAGQLEPLWPARHDHRVLVTSRRKLTTLGRAREVPLNVLTTESAMALVDGALREGHPGDQRIAEDPEQAEHLVTLCGHLPLALKIATALLRIDRRWPVVELAEALVDETTRLDRLHADESGPPEVRAAFAVSYRRLTHDAQELFRRLSISPFPDLDTAAVAVLRDRPLQESRRVLHRLVQAHLVEPATRPDHWRMHDLVRLYATEQALDAYDIDERGEIFSRIFGHCQNTRFVNDVEMRWESDDGRVLARFNGWGDALAWPDTRHGTLIPSHLIAETTGYATTEEYLLSRLQGLEHDEDGSRYKQAAALRRQASHLTRGGLLRAAADLYLQAVGVYQELGDRLNEADTLALRGATLSALDRYAECRRTWRQALALYTELGATERAARIRIMLMALPKPHSKPARRRRRDRG